MGKNAIVTRRPRHAQNLFAWIEAVPQNRDLGGLSWITLSPRLSHRIRIRKHSIREAKEQPFDRSIVRKKPAPRAKWIVANGILEVGDPRQAESYFQNQRGEVPSQKRRCREHRRHVT